MLVRFIKNWTLPLAMLAGTLGYFFFADISISISYLFHTFIVLPYHGIILGNPRLSENSSQLYSKRLFLSREVSAAKQQ